MRVFRRNDALPGRDRSSEAPARLRLSEMGTGPSTSEIGLFAPEFGDFNPRPQFDMRQNLVEGRVTGRLAANPQRPDETREIAPGDAPRQERRLQTVERVKQRVASPHVTPASVGGIVLALQGQQRRDIAKGGCRRRRRRPVCLLAALDRESGR